MRGEEAGRGEAGRGEAGREGVKIESYCTSFWIELRIHAAVYRS